METECKNVVIGDVMKEWTDGDEDGKPCDLCAYVQVAVTIRGKLIRVGTMIGVPEWQHDDARNSGAGVRPYCTAWWADSSDHQDVPQDARQAIENALCEASYRLWTETLEARSVKVLR